MPLPLLLLLLLVLLIVVVFVCVGGGAPVGDRLGLDEAAELDGVAGEEARVGVTRELVLVSLLIDTLMDISDVGAHCGQAACGRFFEAFFDVFFVSKM